MRTFASVFIVLLGVCGRTKRLVRIDEVRSEPTCQYRIGVTAGAGVKVYMSPNAFFNIGAVGSYSRPAATISSLAGFGVDFLRLSMRITSLALLVSLFSVLASDAFAQAAVEWRDVAEAIPLGTKVKVQTLDGKRVSGTLVRVDDRSLQVKRYVRRPEAARVIAFDRISNIETDKGAGITWAKAIGIGLGLGAGTLLTMFVIALQLD